MYEDVDSIAKELRLAVRRERHNALAEVETFCTGTASKLKRYAPLLRHIAMVKENIRVEMRAIESPFNSGGSAAHGGDSK